MAKWLVVCDMAPDTVPGTNGCHEYIFGRYRTKKEAQEMADRFNFVAMSEKARVEKDGN